MNREPWVAYVVVIGVVALMMYGKYLMGKGDGTEPSSNNSEKEKKKEEEGK